MFSNLGRCTKPIMYLCSTIASSCVGTAMFFCFCCCRFVYPNLNRSSVDQMKRISDSAYDSPPILTDFAVFALVTGGAHADVGWRVVGRVDAGGSVEAQLRSVYARLEDSCRNARQRNAQSIEKFIFYLRMLNAKCAML